MISGDMHKRVQDWMSKQGYTLEMKVAKDFQKQHLNVNTGVFYSDCRTKAAREIDLRVSSSMFLDQDRFLLHLDFIIECKYSRDKPWILFKSSNKSYPDLNMCFNNASYYGKLILLELSVSSVLNNNFLFKTPSELYYGATRAFETNKDVAYSSVMSVCGAIDSLVSSESESSEFSKAYSTHIYFPVIITETELFESSLNESNEIVLNRIKWGKLYWKNPELLDTRYLVDIVSYEYLGDYVASIKEASKDIASKVPAYIPKTVNKLQGIVSKT